ncbi:transglutaminase TgpA family protein [Azotobacter salinestris]|uniref:transglutaminase TgpA family protein n=1 Tax=Azotobacter salinestris TaxID=69964 RepID=UPI0032DF89B2
MTTKPGAALQPIPRVGLTWLLVAQLLVVLPHLGHLPLWIVGLWLGCAAWRIQIFRMRAPYPNGWIKAGLMLGTGFGVYLSRGGLVGLEAGVVLLIAAFILKLVEMRSRRDALVVIFLGFFALATACLFEDGILAALYYLLPLTALLAALIGLQQSALAAEPWATLRLAGSLLLQAAPLMLLLFLFFPRIEPLWSLPGPRERGVTGLSDSMTPGDIAELGQSGELVFRASFEGPVPERSRLYWRALTLEHFDGRRWSQALGLQGLAPLWERRGEPLAYSIVMQPSNQPWLYSLDVAEGGPGDARLMEDFRLQQRHPVTRMQLYRVTSWPDARREPKGAVGALQRALQLPEQGNSQSRAWAAELRRRHRQPEALVQALLDHFGREAFHYTLKPPRLGRDSIDEFLFSTRRGFCEHFSSAMTFVLRAAGIPARVVTGYQGGEFNPAGNYLLVHQFDAHAWVEYWQPQHGWTSVDPTFQVAPERIERGLEQALGQDQDFLEGAPLSLARYRGIDWFNRLRLSWDNLSYGWQRWVLGYQGERQMQVLRAWLGSADLRLLGLSAVAAVATMLALVALWLFRPWRREGDAQQRLFGRFERLLARHGLHRAPGEGPRAFAERAARRLPALAAEILAFVALFEAQRYGGRQGKSDELARALRRLRRALPWRTGEG